MKLCAVSIDVDPFDCYYGIHGLGTPPTALRNAIIARALPRFRALLEQNGITATFFIVGRDLEPSDNPSAREAAGHLRKLAGDGHELANHSFEHGYRFAKRPAKKIEHDILRAHHIITEETGCVPVGFRAPGYDISGRVMSILADAGYLYDSSVLPAPAYYGAKLAAMAVGKLRGKPSAATITDPRALAARTQPYIANTKRPWRAGNGPMIEFPIGVTRYSRLPAIGTAIAVAPRSVRNVMMKSVARGAFFNFELHGIDLIDAEQDSIPGILVKKQPDLQVPLATKRARIQAALDLIAETHQFKTLAAASETLFPQAVAQSA